MALHACCAWTSTGQRLDHRGSDGGAWGRGPGQFIIRAKDLIATRYDPCEYVFEWRCNGLVVVLREAKVLGEH